MRLTPVVSVQKMECISYHSSYKKMYMYTCICDVDICNQITCSACHIRDDSVFINRCEYRDITVDSFKCTNNQTIFYSDCICSTVICIY